MTLAKFDKYKVTSKFEIYEFKRINTVVIVYRLKKNYTIKIFYFGRSRNLLESPAQNMGLKRILTEKQVLQILRTFEKQNNDTSIKENVFVNLKEEAAKISDILKRGGFEG